MLARQVTAVISSSGEPHRSGLRQSASRQVYCSKISTRFRFKTFIELGKENMLVDQKNKHLGAELCSAFHRICITSNPTPTNKHQPHHQHQSSKPNEKKNYSYLSKTADLLLSDLLDLLLSIGRAKRVRRRMENPLGELATIQVS